MEKVKTYLKKYGMLIIMLALVVVVANICRESSPITYAKYRTTVDGTDTTRVAKWQITKNSILNGENIQLDSGFRTEVLEGSGTWAFQITNDSEVTATVEPSSKIRIRLDNDSFRRESSSTIKWNFLYNDTKAIDNPISFYITAYKVNIKELLKYQGDNETISYDDYMNLDSESKQNYKQIINKNISPISLQMLSLNSNASYTFTLDSENINSKMFYYYYLDITFEDLIKSLSLTNQSEFLNFGINDKKDLTFVIDWSVSSSTSSDDTVDESQNVYYGYKLVEDTVPTGFNPYPNATSVYQISDKNYYVCRSDEMNFYDYTKYSSSLIGGEPGFEFTSDTGGTVKIKYSDLDEKQKRTIMNYADLTDNYTLEDLKHYVEKLEYNQYTTYLSDNDKLQAALGYLSYGLKVNIQFELNVSQIKPGS